VREIHGEQREDSIALAPTPVRDAQPVTRGRVACDARPPLRSFLVVYVGLALLAPLFTVLERWRPATPTPRTARALRTDLVYWFVTPLLTGTFTRVLTLGVVGLAGYASGFGTEGERFLARVGDAMPFGHLPFVLAFPVALLVADAVGYASHRLRHTAALWRLHAVHHGIEELTALGAARLHPLDEAIDGVLIGASVLLLGFAPSVFAAIGPFCLLHTIFLHANVPWSFGPIGRVLASPRFHRRHHARDLPPANYGGVFALWDVVFGTFDMPTHDPVPFGIVERDVPEGFFGQLAYPVRRLARLARGEGA
jgi:sterol desaturase/sphingolipid hydroxylase (fatty acid hydroxylase superfamily)